MTKERKCCCKAIDAKTCFRRRHNIGVDDCFAHEDAEEECFCVCHETHELELHEIRQSEEDARAELEADGVDVDGFLSRLETAVREHFRQKGN
jgi:hypothetical protein